MWAKVGTMEGTLGVLRLKTISSDPCGELQYEDQESGTKNPCLECYKFKMETIPKQSFQKKMNMEEWVKRKTTTEE